MCKLVPDFKSHFSSSFGGNPSPPNFPIRHVWSSPHYEPVHEDAHVAGSFGYGGARMI